MHIHTVGIDIAKSVFHLVALDERGAVVVRKKFSRPQLLVFTANLQADLIGMEACCGAHFLARSLEAQGHSVRLMPAEYVKPYVKSNKNDFIDAEAIAEAVRRPSMRFVPVKNDEQLDLQALHRVRERWIQRKVALTNQIRGLLLERGFAVRVGSEYLWKTLPAILEDADNGLSGRFRISHPLFGRSGVSWRQDRYGDRRDRPHFSLERRMQTASSDPRHRSHHLHRPCCGSW